MIALLGFGIIANPGWIIKPDQQDHYQSAIVSKSIEILPPRFSPSDLTARSSHSAKDHTRPQPTTRNDLQLFARCIK
jgi:hypothetical protein